MRHLYPLWADLISGIDILQDLLTKMPTQAEVATQIKQILNPALKSIGINDINVNRDTDKVYAISLDGTAAENLMEDLAVCVNEDLSGAWGLIRSDSKVLKGIGETFRELGETFRTAHDRVVDALRWVRPWAQGMSLAFKMKPALEDYDLVKKHLALFVVNKLRWLGTSTTTTWYEDECCASSRETNAAKKM